MIYQIIANDEYDSRNWLLEGPDNLDMKLLFRRFQADIQETGTNLRDLFKELTNKEMPQTNFPWVVVFVAFLCNKHNCEVPTITTLTLGF